MQMSKKYYHYRLFLRYFISVAFKKYRKLYTLDF